MLIATAGHIDHGKTTLVRALTGVDTDRLPEERARGISIDLGFAYWRPDDETLIGFVDVPGHERFVRNMLAGVCGIDTALVVVAADDGVMPQTIEHVQILDLLGIERGVVAITKTDRVDAARLLQVRSDIARLLSKTALAAAPICETSAPSGIGVDELGALLRVARKTSARRDGAFRMAIDRAFTVSGAGTVVTGTVLSGAIATGAQLSVSPAGTPVRVRGLQAAGRVVERVGQGQRCAVNLAGIEVGAIHRGDWLFPDNMHAPTSRFSARIRILPSRDAGLRHDAAVHVHIGAAAISGRILVPAQRSIAPDDICVVIVKLDQSTCLFNGQRFVLRDASGQCLLGGGQVIDPFVPLRQRDRAAQAEVDAALELGHADAALTALLATAGQEVDALRFQRTFNLTKGQARAAMAAANAVHIGRSPGILVSAATVASMATEIRGLLADYHAHHPERGGLTRHELRRAMAGSPSQPLIAHLLRELSEAGEIESTGSLLRLPGHSPNFSDAETALWRAVSDIFDSQPPRPLAIADIARELRASEPSVRAMLYRRRLNGDVWSIDEIRFLSREQVSALAKSAEILALRHEQGFTAAQFRDETGIGRNHVIRILEFFDRLGVTARRGDVRVVRSDHGITTLAAGLPSTDRS